MDDDDGNNKATSTEGMESELAEMAAGQPISLSSKDPAFFGLPPIEEWGAPVFVRFRNGSKININVKGDEGFCNFSTPLFEGKLSFCIADLQNSDMQSILRIAVLITRRWLKISSRSWKASSWKMLLARRHYVMREPLS